MSKGGRRGASSRVIALVVALFAACSARTAGEAKDPLEGFEPTGEFVKCVHSYQIKETRVLDGRNILFRLGVSDYYVNRLPHDCPGLKIQNRFSYKLRGVNDLCNVDAITVIDGTGTGAGCLLGDFEKLKKKPSAEK